MISPEIKELIYKITEKEFGEIPVAIEEVGDQEQKSDKLLFRISLKDRMCVLHMQKSPDALKTYAVEHWCMEAVAQMQVPTPRPIGLGIEGEWAYSFQEFVPGLRGTEMKEETRRIWRALGSYAKKYNTIPADQYRIDLTRVDKQLFDDGFFAKHSLLSEGRITAIRSRIDEIKSWHFLPMLCHSNLDPKNTIVHPEGSIYMLDWSAANGNRAPHAELADLFVHDAGKPNIDGFVEGYGIKPEELDAMTHDVQTLILVRHLTSLRWKIETHPDDWSELESVKSALQSIFDIPDFSAKILFKKSTE